MGCDAPKSALREYSTMVVTPHACSITLWVPLRARTSQPVRQRCAQQELMPSHLDVSPDAPALLGFVNDTLVSTCPPKPRNKVASMWLICAATRVVDMCPVKKLREVIGELQEH